MIELQIRRSVMTGVALTAIGAGLLLHARTLPSVTINACAAADGQLRIIDSGESCRPSERKLTWSVTGPVGPQGPQGEPGPVGAVGPAGEGTLRVSDSTGATVGAFLRLGTPSEGYQHVVVRTIDGALVPLLVTSSGFRANYVPYLYHTTYDCSGQRYIDIFDEPSMIVAPLRPAAVQRGHAIYAAGPARLAMMVTREYFSPSADYRSPGVCQPAIFNVNAAPAKGIDLNTLQLTPPFSITVP